MIYDEVPGALEYQFTEQAVPVPSSTYSFHPKAGGKDTTNEYNHVIEMKINPHRVVIFCAVKGRTTRQHRWTETAANETICSTPERK